ncbi:MAG: reductive dehalogenase [Candidatus Saccharicenans sp.]
MQAIFAILNIVSGTIIALGALLAFVTSLGEGEKRAAALSFTGLILNCLLWTAFILFHYFPVVRIANIIVLVALLVFTVISALKFFPAAPQPELHSIMPYDERDHMFSRNALKFDPAHKKIYYETLHPEFLEVDTAIHAKPELGEPGGAFYAHYYSPAFVAGFSFLERLKPLTAGKPAQYKAAVDSIHLKKAIRILALHYGAADVGFTKLEKHHFYSHRGRTTDNWGEPIECTHKTGIVIIVPMKVHALKQAPRIQVINESARSYTEAAKVACVVAEYLRLLGYDALAHTDGNYLAPLVPIAAEAGLGEVSRMGLLIHPRLGPCLRLSMVSTELELPPDPRQEFGVANFCRLCKKCADNCPTRSISRDDEPTLDRGVRHWKIIQEKCYSFWKSIGTDCGICLSVCPYTKENNLFHRMVRSYISRNSFNQRLALFFDDLFYGRRRRIPV